MRRNSGFLRGDVWQEADYDLRKEGFEEEPLGYQQYGHGHYSRPSSLWGKDPAEQETVVPLDEKLQAHLRQERQRGSRRSKSRKT